MPEGDTIARAAARLQQWMGGRTITAARSVRERVPPERLVGQRVEAVEARGKHLLVRLSSGETLRTHMRMSGSWHVYRSGERWRRPGHLARVVLEAGDRVAVCFSAPDVELVAARDEPAHPALSRLGPDVMVAPVDLDEAVRRFRSLDPATTVGEALLDQRVVAGIGNIFRCEALFRERVDPHAAVGDLDDAALAGLVRTASALMRAPARPRPRVYRRTGLPCPACRGAVATEPLGERTLHWCPRCQTVGREPSGGAGHAGMARSD